MKYIVYLLTLVIATPTGLKDHKDISKEKQTEKKEPKKPADHGKPKPKPEPEPEPEPKDSFKPTAPKQEGYTPEEPTEIPITPLPIIGDAYGEMPVADMPPIPLPMPSADNIPPISTIAPINGDTYSPVNGDAYTSTPTNTYGPSMADPIKPPSIEANPEPEESQFSEAVEGEVYNGSSVQLSMYLSVLLVYYQ